jgi:hypothetical protein
MVLVKTPVPVPSEVCESEIVGVPVVFQHIPLAVTELPPWSVTLPPPEAEEDPVGIGVVVTTVGGPPGTPGVHVNVKPAVG